MWRLYLLYLVFRSWRTYSLDKATAPHRYLHIAKPFGKHIGNRCRCYCQSSSSCFRPPSLNTEDNFNNTFLICSPALCLRIVLKWLALTRPTAANIKHIRQIRNNYELLISTTHTFLFPLHRLFRMDFTERRATSNRIRGDRGCGAQRRWLRARS